MTAYFKPDDCRLDEFASICGQTLTPDDAPLATEIAKNVPIYDMALLRSALTGPARRTALMSEWAEGLRTKSGIVVLRNAYAETSAIDAASGIFDMIIEQEAGSGGADHFAAAGNNARIWNSLQKLCLAAPEVFGRYFGNAAVAAVSEAWLGPNYQITSQINLVRPGGAAQLAHRDYHLGFQTAEVSTTYPAHVHDLSPALTLQGAIAHTDMSIESGPTKLLPFSQAYRAGYAAWRRDDFRAYFEDNYIQLPLKKGDAVFFNPALFHAAGANSSKDVQRMVNLLQVSSAFGRAMESIDRHAMCTALYPVLADLNLDSFSQDAAIAACAEGYSFPTNLDRDPPSGGLAPKTQADLFREAIDNRASAKDFEAALDALAARQTA